MSGGGGRVVETAPPYPAFIIGGRVEGRVGIIGDLHIGMEASLLRSSPLSTFHSEEVIGRVKSLVEDYSLNALVVLGDLKHSILRPPPNERFLITSLLTYLSGRGVRVYLVKGNHDSRIEEIISGFKDIHLSEKPWIELPLLDPGSALITHGDRRISPSTIASSNPIILGHLHPCLKLTGEGGKVTILRVFLEIKARHLGGSVKDVFVIPAFNPLCCYIFNPYGLRRRLSILRDLDYDLGRIKAFDLARNYLGDMESLQEYATEI